MKIDGVFSGGGVKAFAFLGALDTIEDKGFVFERLAGTSAGSILASFLAAGYTSSEIKEALDEVELEKFLDPTKLGKYVPVMKWIQLYFTMGLYQGDVLEKWLYEKLAAKGVYTFADLREEKLKIIVTDLSLGRLVVVPDDLQRIYNKDPSEFLISKAIRMSIGLPYFFIPVKLPNKKIGYSVMVDGGLLSNFPMWVLEKENHELIRPILGVKLSEQINSIPERKIKNAFSFIHSIFLTMMNAHDTRYIAKRDAANIIFIPVKEVESSDFSLTEDDKKKLIQLGKERAKEFLKSWP
ncbi:patatin-like phospholipase family protein [Radiobacillus sp. PE A8.2]|uniref:patatin-like phospholipase family protein n=1 Tax=Radiobacillus sp. PE A8.2 TaxID=3380349 RepID=UPI00389053E2